MPNLQMPRLLDKWNFLLHFQCHRHPKSIHFKVNRYYVAFVFPIYSLCYIVVFSVFIYRYINRHRIGKTKVERKKFCLSILLMFVINYPRWLQAGYWEWRYPESFQFPQRLLTCLQLKSAFRHIQFSGLTLPTFRCNSFWSCFEKRQSKINYWHKIRSILLND